MKRTAACALLAAILCVGGAQPENGVISSNEGSYRPKHGDHPYHVKLRIAQNTGTMMTCCGALIDPSWVITAARCIDDRASGIFATFMWKQFGIIDSSRPEKVLETNVNTANAITHPQFDGIFNDLGLIRTRYIHPTDNIRPIQFQKETINFPVGEPFKTCFWGLNSDRTAPSQELRCADMTSVQLLSRCGVPPFPFPNHICALGPANCDSDRGNPLIMEEEGPTLIGILSYGPPQSCASVETDQHIAIAHTRVSLYSDWISSVINS